MARKSKKAQERLDKVKFEAEAQIRRMNEAAEKRAKELQEQIEQAEAVAKKALEEEEQLYKETEREIKDMCTERGFFCGVILTKRDVLAIVDMAIDVKDNIKIPFRLYVEEEQSPIPKVDAVEQEPKKQE